MRHETPEPLQVRHPSHSLAYSVCLPPRRTRHYTYPHGHLHGPQGTARGGQEQRLLPGRGGLHARAGEALGPFDVARSSERTDEQERRMHGDETEGGSQGSRADAGAEMGCRTLNFGA